jgi:adenylate cyclase
MGVEIEVKFLVDPKYLTVISNKAMSVISITQGYLFEDGDVRVRIKTEDGVKKSYLTIKGNREGDTRDEFEYEIPNKDGIEMIDKFSKHVIFKTRYKLKYKKDIWEIDVFHGDNDGLIIGEVETPKLDYDVMQPPWIDKWDVVTDDVKYYNSYIARNPYKNWSKNNE